MKKEQISQEILTQNNGFLQTDYLVWRVINAKKRYNEAACNRVYNDRPRLRDETHH